MICAYIMAGGFGERFWPLSTSERPKQLLKLLSDKSITGAKEFFNFLNFRIGGWPDEIKRA